MAATDDVYVYSDEATEKAHRLVKRSATEAALPIPGSMHIRPGSKLIANGTSFTVLTSGERDITVRSDDGVVQSWPVSTVLAMRDLELVEAEGVRRHSDVRKLADCSADELARAVERLEAVRDEKSSSYAPRSISRFASVVAHAANDLEALIALVDNRRASGNWKRKISAKNDGLVTKAISERFNTPDQPTKKGAYGKYVELCESQTEDSGQSITPIAYPTFCRYCDEQQKTELRRGRRAAYQEAAIIPEIGNLFPVHGVRPHEVVYVDHTTANLATVSPHGVPLGKPTLTIGVDGNTTHPRAFVLNYDPPST